MRGSGFLSAICNVPITDLRIGGFRACRLLDLGFGGSVLFVSSGFRVRGLACVAVSITLWAGDHPSLYPIFVWCK